MTAGAATAFAPGNSDQESLGALDRPFEHFKIHHRRIFQALERLEAAFAGAPPRDALGEAAQAIQLLESEGFLHMQDEEESFFPRLQDRLSPEYAAHLDVLTQQHQEARELVAGLRETLASERTAAASAGGIKILIERFVDQFRFHADFEDTELAVVAQRILRPDEIAAISREMKQRRGLPAG